MEPKEDEENPNNPSNGNPPFLVDKDGNILGYSIPDGGYIDTGHDVPPEGEDIDAPEDPEGPTDPENPENPGGEGGDPGDGGEEGGDGPGEGGNPKNPNPKGKEGFPTDWNPYDPKPYRPVSTEGISIPRDEITEAFFWDIRRSDPIVLDLNGDGISLIKEDGKHFYDLGNDGVAENIDWVAPTDGFLVHDTNSTTIDCIYL